MLQRKAMKQLEFWRAHKAKQAMLVDGARQVGKTHLVRTFGKANYNHTIEINFIDNEDARDAIDAAHNANDVFFAISAYANDDLIAGETLIFLDEIQACRDIVTKIKFLVDRFSGYDFILSGSLLGVDLKSVRSVPVGYLDSITMFPLDFEEYCWANKVQPAVFDEVRSAFAQRRPVNDAVHRRLAGLFHEYLIVGGMPQAVENFVQEHNIQSLRMYQQNIIDRYREDIAQYADGVERVRAIRRIYDLIPAQLNQQNKRFKVASVTAGARYVRYQEEFLWLTDAGVALPVYNVDEPRYPLMLAQKSNLFKLFANDVGLLTCMCGMDVVRDMLRDRTDVNYGALYENAVAQELIAHGVTPYYFKNNAIGELDFLMESSRGVVVPIEVKSGKTYNRHSALNRALATPNYGMERGVVLAETNVQVQERIDYLPVYMVAVLDRETVVLQGM
ncbi:ATPase [Bifidobacterium hapali]|uniref:ATPase n=1 Tax=Bifidobacterium hapali TaxID=1630172 RepID=A0A261G4H7_9BIFI|nr:AAA family ATPase [Bifidobacterium hapali]OZG66322.1 ATPase [Bifidobacterium hapali]